MSELSVSGLKFIEKCMAAKDQFGIWMNDLDEYEIRDDFSRLSFMMKSLDDIIIEAQGIVRGDEKI